VITDKVSGKTVESNWADLNVGDNYTVVYTYDELRNAIHGTPIGLTCRVRLGSDIIQKDTRNYGGMLIANNANFYLDLNGYTLSRTAVTNDIQLFEITTGKLTIDDSKGGGQIICDMEGASLFRLCEADAHLIINGGTFTSKQGYCIFSTDGTTEINDGTFRGMVHTVNFTGGNMVFYGGNFLVPFGPGASHTLAMTSDYGDFQFMEATVQGTISISGKGNSSPPFLVYHVTNFTDIYINGRQMTVGDRVSELTGNPIQFKK
ncbi:MAG: hypothetical protein HUJ80_04325, partial [Firmicutes bacterium]|nr:hypothetical protein [Bacillota bacterium]